MVELLLDGKSLSESIPGTLVTAKPAISAAQRDVKTTDVPGRLQGTLTQLLGWKDITWSPQLALYDFTDLNAAWRRTKSVLQGAQRVAMSDDPGYYRIIKSVAVGELTIDDVEVSGTYKPSFVLDPLEYQDTPTQTFSDNFDLTNPGNVDAQPLIALYGSGTAKLSVNTSEFSIDNVVSTVVIDVNNHTVTSSGKDITTSTKGDWPVLVPGVNHILLTGITKVEINPRWCYV